MVKHFYAFDWLRILLVFFVVGFHMPFAYEAKYLPQGYLAVELFFVMSGFLLARSLEKYLGEPGDMTVHFGGLVWRRFKRLYPEYLFVTVLVCLLAPWLPYSDPWPKLCWNLILFMETGTAGNIVAGAWFVSALFWASFVLILLTLRFKRVFITAGCPIIFLAASTILFQYSNNNLMLAGNMIGIGLNAGLLRAAAGLCAGMFAFRLWQILPPFKPWFAAFAFTVSICEFVRLCVEPEWTTAVYSINLLGIVMILSAAQLNAVFKPFSENSLVRLLADSAYMTFLTNLAVIALLTRFAPHWISEPKIGHAVVWFACFAVSVGLYGFFKPCRALIAGRATQLSIFENRALDKENAK